MFYNEVVDAIKEAKKAAKLDFARSQGTCCGSCTWSTIKEGTKGIWLKHYKTGANRSKWREADAQYIAHDLTDDQLKIVIATLSQYFEVKYDFASQGADVITIRDKKDPIEATEQKAEYTQLTSAL
jgi:hypothetical protein